jgi:hypothetical protein
MYCNAECHYAECRYAECGYAECRYAECRGAFLHAYYVPPLVTKKKSLITLSPVCRLREPRELRDK